MNKELSDFIQYRISRAKESLDESRLLAGSNHWNACVNRLYYACFYSVLALLCKHNLSSSKHSGVRSLFNQNFVKTGIFSKETAIVYNALFERRQESDYEDFVSFNENDVNTWTVEAENFVNAIIKLIG